MDESGFTLNYPLSKCWMRVHQQTRLPASTQVRSGCLLAGVVDGYSAEVWMQPLQKLSSECLIGFFSWLFLEALPEDKLVLVMDNASSHRSQSLQAFFALFEHRVRVLWLPPYSPDMNLIERFWKHLKQRVTANRLFSGIQALLEALQAELIVQNNPDYEFRFSFSNY
jgi:transposase